MSKECYFLLSVLNLPKNRILILLYNKLPAWVKFSFEDSQNNLKLNQLLIMDSGA